MPALIIVVWAISSALLAVVWPLLVYSTSLALFGLAHVLCELRYVDARFGARLPRTFWVGCAVPLALIVGLRVLRLLGLVGSDVAVGSETALVTVLVAVAVPLAWTAARIVGVVGVVVAAVFGWLTLVAPIALLVTLAVLHNATPLGFLVERAPAGRRLRSLLLGSVLFFGVPALVATGWASTLLANVIDLDRSVLPTGPLVDHYPVYLWPRLCDEVVAAQLFSAAVCAQLLHYGAVIVWLPRSLQPAEQPTLPWPRPLVFVVVTGALTLVLLASYASDFKGARGLYGLVAAVHAWIELPVFVAGFAVGAHTPRLGGRKAVPTRL